MCACGCKEEIISKSHHKYRNIKFIEGHFSQFRKGKLYEEMFGKEKSRIMKYRQHLNSSGRKRKGKTYKEIYGKEKAKKIKEKLSKHSYTKKYKGKTLEERYGKKKAQIIKKKLSIFNSKSFEEKYGKEIANKIREKQSLARKGKNKWTTQKIINIHKNNPPMQKSDWNRIRKISKNEMPHFVTVCNRFGSIENLEIISGKKFLPTPRGKLGNNEKMILDQIQVEIGLTIDRAFRVGKYYPDGYVHETNTIYEVDESAHYSGIQPMKDKIREEKIKEMIPGIEFIRINEQEKLEQIKNKSQTKIDIFNINQ